MAGSAARHSSHAVHATVDSRWRAALKPISPVELREDLTRYQDALVLVVLSDGDQVNLLPLRQALQDHPDGSLMMSGMKPPAES